MTIYCVYRHILFLFGICSFILIVLNIHHLFSCQFHNTDDFSPAHGQENLILEFCFLPFVNNGKERTVLLLH